MPDFLIKVFNELIKVKFDGKSSVVSYKEVRSYVTSVSTYDNELNYRLSYELFTKMTIPQINEYVKLYSNIGWKVKNEENEFDIL